MLSKYDEKLGEISRVKEAAMEKEMLLKDSETKVYLPSSFGFFLLTVETLFSGLSILIDLLLSIYTNFG